MSNNPTLQFLLKHAPVTTAWLVKLGTESMTIQDLVNQFMLTLNRDGYEIIRSNTYGGEELDFVREVDLLSFEYAEIINNTAGQGSNSVEYPTSNLGYQMALTAQMISGGLETPIYRIYQNGFDTHANQNNDHTQLMMDLNNSLQAFIEDLSNQSLLDRVLIVTTSEFGRRYFENGSNGTDHGTSAPCMVFGDSVVPELFGEQPSLSSMISVNYIRPSSQIGLV